VYVHIFRLSDNSRRQPPRFSPPVLIRVSCVGTKRILSGACSTLGPARDIIYNLEHEVPQLDRYGPVKAHSAKSIEVPSSSHGNLMHTTGELTFMKWNLSRSTTIALLLSPVGILLISITRLLIISNYNAATASTIVSSGGYVNTLLGTLIPVVPLLMPYFALILLFSDLAGLAVLALVAAAFTSPSAMRKLDIVRTVKKDEHLYSNNGHFHIFLILAIAFLVAFALQFLGYDIRASVRTATLTTGLALIPFVFTLYPLPVQSDFYAQQLRQPWLPAESIALTSGQIIVGYVLSKSDGWFVILQADNRNVYYLPSRQVTTQEVCQLGPMSSERPVIDLFGASALVPSCP
jgi:hypothetical protein